MNDAIKNSINELRSAIEVGKSIVRNFVDVDINAAEYLCGLAEIAIEAETADPSEEFKELEDLKAEVDTLNTTVVERDGAILELQQQIETNTDAFNIIVSERDDLQVMNATQAKTIKSSGKKKK